MDGGRGGGGRVEWERGVDNVLMRQHQLGVWGAGGGGGGGVERERGVDNVLMRLHQFGGGRGAGEAEGGELSNVKHIMMRPVVSGNEQLYLTIIGILDRGLLYRSSR